MRPRPEGPLRLADLAAETLIVYPKAPRPSYADQVLALFRERGLKPPGARVRELQTALGLVAAEAGYAWCRPRSSVCAATMCYRPMDRTRRFRRSS